MKTLQNKAWFKSKTVWLGLATLLLSILEFTNTLELPVGIYSIIGIAIIILRFLTSKPITFN